MTPAQERRLRSFERRIRQALEDALELAREEGCKNPMVFIEPESGVFVLDRDSPHYVSDGSASDRRKAIVLSLTRALPAHTDAGGW
jgi:hypothetical protein